MNININRFLGLLTFASLTFSAVAQAQITNLVVSSDATTESISYSYVGTQAFLRVYLDTDKNKNTGYIRGEIGADYLADLFGPS